MRYVFDKFDVEPFEEWEIIELLCPNFVQPAFLESGEGRYNPALANQTAEIVHPDTGIFFPLPESVMAEGVKGVSLVVQNDKEVQKTLLDAVVESCADMAMDSEQFPGMRGRWVLALMGLSLIYDGQDQPISSRHRRAQPPCHHDGRYRLSNPIRACLDDAAIDELCHDGATTG